MIQCKHGDSLEKGPVINIICLHSASAELAMILLFLLATVSGATAECGDPPSIPNANHNGTGAPYPDGTSVVYSCGLGYTVSGPVRYICRGDNWQDGNIECRIRSCPSVEPPKYGHYADKQRSRVVGSTLRFLCDPCYALQGSPSIVCRSDGAWSSPVPSCELKKCLDFSVANGMIDQDFTTDDDKNACGRVNTITCHNGYQLHGPRQITCQEDNSWSGNPTCERPRCEPLPVTNNKCFLKLSNDSGTIGSSPTISCDDDATLDGPANVVCKPDGRWSDSSSRCYCSCYPGGSNTAHMRFSGLTERHVGQKYIKHGSILNWTCDGPHYEKSTMDPVRCNDGAFTQDFSCRRRTGCRPLHVNSDKCLEMLSDKSTDVGSTPVIFCYLNATLEGSENPVCQRNFEWSDSSSRCYCSCDPKLLKVDDAVYTNLSSDGLIRHKEILNWTCEIGTRKNTEKTVRCVDGVFEPSFSCMEEQKSKAGPIIEPVPDNDSDTKVIVITVLATLVGVAVIVVVVCICKIRKTKGTPTPEGYAMSSKDVSHAQPGQARRSQWTPTPEGYAMPYQDAPDAQPGRAVSEKHQLLPSRSQEHQDYIDPLRTTDIDALRADLLTLKMTVNEGFRRMEEKLNELQEQISQLKDGTG